MRGPGESAKRMTSLCQRSPFLVRPFTEVARRAGKSLLVRGAFLLVTGPAGPHPALGKGVKN